MSEAISELYKTIGENIRMNRKIRQITQEDLALALDYTRTSLSNIEQGKQRLGIDVLYQFANCLGVSVFNLLPKEPFDDLERARINQELNVIAFEIRELETRAKTLRQAQQSIKG